MGHQPNLQHLVAALETGPPLRSSDYDLVPDLVLPAGRKLKPAAVLIGVIEDRVILTKRASHLKHHPGQIAFPGGKSDPGDNGPAGTALREAREEIGLDPSRVKVLSELPCHETVTGFEVTPILAEITSEFDVIPEAGEVAEVFRVPLSFLMQPTSFRVERRRWRGVWRPYYVVPFGPYYIWGATARMLKALSDRASA